MSDVDSRALSAFAAWLVSLGDDTRAVADVVADASVPAAVRKPLAGSLNYLFKSLDLIDDGIEGLGFMDDAFVLRVAAASAAAQGSLPDTLAALAEDAKLVTEFLGDLSPRLEKFVAGLGKGVVRGRSVEAILEEVSVREEMLGDVRGWASRYAAPKFLMDEQSLVKLRSFLSAKLPA